MIKLLNILNEGAIQLTPKERQQVEQMLPDIIEVISGKYIGDNRQMEVGDMEIVSADGTPMKVKIYVGNDLSHPNSSAYHQAADRKNPDDNHILIQQFQFSPYFKGLSGADIKLNKLVTGDENVGLEKLRLMIKHEIIHAKDPALNQHYRKEPYDSSKEEVYYKSWAEFQTMTGQFFEAITTGVDRALESGVSKDTILKALDNILQYYSGKVKFFTDDTNDFIQGTKTRNAFQSLIKFASSIVLGSNQSAIQTYAAYIQGIKQYNPEGYKEYLTDLYKTIDQAKDKLKTMQEMKSNTINEVIRMQKLAGLLTEAEESNNKDSEIDSAMKAGLSALTSDAESLEEIEEDDDQPQELNESVIALIASSLLAAPKIIEWIGKAISFVSKPFIGADESDEHTVGKKIQHFAHKWEKLYLKAIIWVVKKTKFAKKLWMTDDNKIDEQKLVVLSKYLYAAILAVAIGNAIGTVLGPASPILKGIEASLGGIKATEIATIASKVKGQL